MKKYSGVFATLLLLQSCAAQKPTQVGSVHVTVTKGNTTRIYGEVFDDWTKKKYPEFCDVWVNEKPYELDSNGRFSIDLKPGSYLITGRCLSLANHEYKLVIKKNEEVKLIFRLRPDPNQGHPDYDTSRDANNKKKIY